MESVGTGQFNKSPFGFEKSMPGEFALFVLCTMLFFGSACSMLQNVFDWEALSFEMMFRIFFVTVSVGALMEGATLLKNRFARLTRFGIGIAGIVGFILYLIYGENGAEIVSGLRAMGIKYLESWFGYYDRELRYSVGDVDEITIALRFVMTVFCFILVWYSRGMRQPAMPVLVPFLVFILSLLVGEVPDGQGLFMMFGGVLLSNAAVFREPEFVESPGKYGKQSGRFRYFSWVPVGVCIFLLCVSGKFIGASAAEVAVDDGKERVNKQLKETAEAVIEWDGWNSFRVTKDFGKALDKFLKRNDVEVKNNPDADYARLRNDKPEHEDEVVLKIALDKKPLQNLYLVDFYADQYSDGIWDTDLKNFKEECETAGFSYEGLSEDIVSFGVRNIVESYGGTSLTDLYNQRVSGWMYYAKKNRVKACLPYFSELNSEDVRAEGDGRYIKDDKITKVSFDSWNYDINELAKVLFENRKAEENWEGWYESYVEEHYLEVPGGMEYVGKVAEEISNSEINFFTVKGAESINLDRLNLAYRVADWMRKNTEYSLELPELPKKSDPIEFFLETSRQGYCMHYASAAVMLLRQLGVPARYVSGYVVEDLKQSIVDGDYEAIIMDNNGHAWAEIYLDGFGWVPMEMTKGYSVPLSGEMMFDVDSDDVPGVVPTMTPEEPEKPVEKDDKVQPTIIPFPTSVPDSIPSIAPNTGDGKNNSAQGSPGTGVSPMGGVDGPDIKEKSEKKKRDFSVNPVILYVVLAGVILFVPGETMVRKIKQRFDERQIQKQTKHRGNRQWINLLNRRLYRKLRLNGRIRKKDLPDEEYGRALMKQCVAFSREEKERYMYLVKEAAFSVNDFTEDEVEFCHRMYHKVLYEAKEGVEE